MKITNNTISNKVTIGQITVNLINILGQHKLIISTDKDEFAQKVEAIKESIAPNSKEPWDFTMVDSQTVTISANIVTGLVSNAVMSYEIQTL